MLKNLIMAGASKNANDNLFSYVRALGHFERVGDAFYGYMNGIRVDGIPITGAAYVNTRPITLLCDVSGSSLISGFFSRLDEFRLTVGKNRYNGANSYTLVEPFPNS